MKLTYGFIKENLEAYEKARTTIPSVIQYESGEITDSAMRSLKIEKFAHFYDFISEQTKLGFSPVMPDMTWRKLKQILINNTKNERFKKFISSKTQSSFKKLLTQPEVYDRLLNGRWVSKPRILRRGRISSGRRSSEYFDGLSICFLPILNYIIQNDLDVFDRYKKDTDINDIPQFPSQERYARSYMWFSTKLDLESIPYREIDVTNKLIQSFTKSLDEDKIDPRKLNVDYVINSISEKLRRSMRIPVGTNIKCLKTIIEKDKETFIQGKTYKVEDQYVSYGSLMVYLMNELGRREYVKFEHFEDMSLHRDNLLDDLFK